VSRIKSLGRGGRVLLAVAVAGGAFGIATVVQAAIPDTNGVVHGCYVPYGTGNTTLMTYLRLIDTQPSGPMPNKGKACITGETGVDLLGSEFRSLGRNFLGSLSPGDYEVTEFCGPGQIANPLYAESLILVAYLQRESSNVGMAATGTPGSAWKLGFSLSQQSRITVHGSCVRRAEFGLAPTKAGEGQPTFTVTKVG